VSQNRKNWWDDAAGQLQQDVRQTEATQTDEYSEDQTRLAIVHAREDLVLVASNLSALNRQIRIIKIMVGILVGIGAYVAIRL
jgi:hypothetical protein